MTIPADLKRRLDLYVTQCEYEISGLGTVECRNGILVVTGLYLLDQDVSSGSTELLGTAIAKFLAEAPQRGVSVSKLRLWWHSHAKIPSYWSPTDEDAINGFSSAPWFVSIVGNHAGDYQTRIDVFPSDTVPFRIGQEAELMTTYVKEELDSVRSEIAERVRRKTTLLTTTGSRAPSRRKRSSSGSRQPVATASPTTSKQ